MRNKYRDVDTKGGKRRLNIGDLGEKVLVDWKKWNYGIKIWGGRVGEGINLG